MLLSLEGKKIRALEFNRARKRIKRDGSQTRTGEFPRHTKKSTRTLTRDDKFARKERKNHPDLRSTDACCERPARAHCTSVPPTTTDTLVNENVKQRATALLRRPRRGEPGMGWKKSGHGRALLTAPTSAPTAVPSAVHMRAFSPFFRQRVGCRAGARLRLANGHRILLFLPLPCKQRMDCNGHGS